MWAEVDVSDLGTETGIIVMNQCKRYYPQLMQVKPA